MIEQLRKLIDEYFPTYRTATLSDREKALSLLDQIEKRDKSQKKMLENKVRLSLETRNRILVLEQERKELVGLLIRWHSPVLELKDIVPGLWGDTNKWLADKEGDSE